MNEIVSRNATAVLAGWSAAKPAFALMGEYSAGKSSLLNMLLGQPLLPTKVTATHLPTVWITHGEARKLEALDHDGTVTEISEDGLDFGTLDGYVALRFTLPSEILRGGDVIDTPGISDPNLAIDVVGLISAHVDFVIWCSAANQAWRQTEKAAWKTVPRELQDQSLLVVTRVDQIGNAKDVGRVISRCEREAGKFFHSVLPISAKLARSGAEGSWQESGAETLMSAIEARVDAAKSYRAERREREGDPQVEEAPEVFEVPIEEVVVAAENTPDETAEIIDISARIADLENALADVKNETSNDQVFALFDHLKTTFRGDSQASDSHADVIVNLLSVRGSNDMNLPAVIEQVRNEIKDFSEGPWCRLDRVS
ncbi:dynamin family protein [Loktanella sp. S4079]|uniref:dynamin family protein n=1 Tax=Loktanella sp. S4079 TaxID=579483 RepID=UPI000697143C|nr:dynamin family protein [Loktanella sp. S4079]